MKGTSRVRDSREDQGTYKEVKSTGNRGRVRKRAHENRLTEVKNMSGEAEMKELGGLCVCITGNGGGMRGGVSIYKMPED